MGEEGRASPPVETLRRPQEKSKRQAVEEEDSSSRQRSFDDLCGIPTCAFLLGTGTSISGVFTSNVHLCLGHSKSHRRTRLLRWILLFSLSSLFFCFFTLNIGGQFFSHFSFCLKPFGSATVCPRTFRESVESIFLFSLISTRFLRPVELVFVTSAFTTSFAKSLLFLRTLYLYLKSEIDLTFLSTCRKGRPYKILNVTTSFSQCLWAPFCYSKRGLPPFFSVTVV